MFCDEEADVKDPVAALASARGGGIAGPAAACSVLIGPEGGFAEEERAALLKLPNVVRLALGPRILRADTAAVAALDAGPGGARRLALSRFRRNKIKANAFPRRHNLTRIGRKGAAFSLSAAGMPRSLAEARCMSAVR